MRRLRVILSDLPDTGNFKIGDTLTSGEELQFQGIAELLARDVQIYRERRSDEGKAIEQGY